MDTTQQTVMLEEHQAAEQMINRALDIDYLIAAFPRCFFLRHECRRPLKIGILADLAPLVPCGEEELKTVLNKYVRSDGYLHACTEGAIRIDVNGEAAGAVSAKHAAHAKKVLAERERWKLKKQAAREREAETQRNAAAKCKQQAEKSITPMDHCRAAATKRISLADLKAAAAKRREAAA
jgi:ProP effector